MPTRVRIHAIADEAQTRTLCDLFPGARLDVSASYWPKDRACQGRHKTLDVYQTIELSWGDGTNKSHRYCELFRAMMADQVAWIQRSHPPAKRSPRPMAVTHLHWLSMRIAWRRLENRNPGTSERSRR